MITLAKINRKDLATDTSPDRALWLINDSPADYEIKLAFIIVEDDAAAHIKTPVGKAQPIAILAEYDQFVKRYGQTLKNLANR